MKKYLLSLFIFSLSTVFAQVNDSLTFEKCLALATENSPLIKQRGLLPEISQKRIDNLNTNFLPMIYLNGQATYQSDVTKIPIKIPGMSVEEMNKDQYKVTLDVNQTVYDGGNTSQQKKVENITLESDKQFLESELYKIKEKISQLYFGIILLQENEKLLTVMKNEISNKLQKVEAGVKNGVSLPTNADVLKVELIKIDQQLSDIKESKLADINMLGEFINLSLPKNLIFYPPAVPVISEKFENARLEMKVYDLQWEKLAAMKKLAEVKTRPHLSAFAQAGYGRPGLNMLDNKLDDFYMAGIKLNWNLWNWNQNKNDKQLLDLQKDVINTQRNNFEKNLKISLEQQKGNLHKYEDLIEKDKEIITLSENIVKTYSAQLDNGIITSTEYITELNNQLQSKINLENHRLQLIKVKVDYLITNGSY